MAGSNLVILSSVVKLHRCCYAVVLSMICCFVCSACLSKDFRNAISVLFISKDVNSNAESTIIYTFYDKPLKRMIVYFVLKIISFF